jgi:hypothetical protein
MMIPLAQKSNGMYIFGSKDFDGVAELVLREYAPYMLEKAQPLRIEELADEGYSLSIMDYYLSQRGSILGMIFFDDNAVRVVNLEKQIVEEQFMSGTIAIDARLLGEEHQHRRRFTISHEVAHWIIHRQMYYADGPKYNLRRANRFIACRVSDAAEISVGPIGQRRIGRSGRRQVRLGHADAGQRVLSRSVCGHGIATTQVTTCWATVVRRTQPMLLRN